MNLFKLFFIAISGLGIGFTTTELLQQEDQPITTEETTYEEPYYYGCHRFVDDGELFHFIDSFSEEDQQIINEYVDGLLLEQGITIDDLYEDIDLRHDIMIVLWEFIEEQGLEYEDNNYRHGHMGW